MNEQKPGIEWTHPFGRRGYTWNAVKGCLHKCQWQMPDGNVAICYAKAIAERVAQAHYAQGFEHHYWNSNELKAPLKLKQPSGIFLDSMSDLMGWWVPEDEIRQVFDVCRQTPQHIYFLLTKNPSRLKNFSYPANIWTGVSSPPDWMNGNQLTRDQQRRMLCHSLRVLSGLDSAVKWMSFEPLSWDVSEWVRETLSAFPNALNWSVIGAASNGANEFPPEETHLRALLDVLDEHGIPVFYKGNLKSLPYAAANWREYYPPEPKKFEVRT